MKDIQETVDTTPETEEPKKPFATRVYNAARSKTGKTVLAVVGTAGALAGTYVFGFRGGQSNVIELAADLSARDEDFEDTLEIDVVVDETDEPTDSPEEN